MESKKVTTDSGWTSVYPKFTKTTKTNVKYEFFFLLISELVCTIQSLAALKTPIFLSLPTNNHAYATL